MLECVRKKCTRLFAGAGEKGELSCSPLPPTLEEKKENVRQTLSQKCDLIKFAPYFDAGERRLFYLSECLLMFADIFLRSAVVGSVH